MFDIKSKQWIKHFRNFNEDDIEEFAYRLSGYLKNVVKKGGAINTNRILRSLFILDDIARRKEEEEFDFSKTKQKYLVEFAKEIWKEHDINGYGSKYISSLIYTRHEKKISKTAIANWIAAQKEFRKNKEEN